MGVGSSSGTVMVGSDEVVLTISGVAEGCFQFQTEWQHDRPIERVDYLPVVPSRSSRRMSKCPLCRAVS
jgi:hypothetical protein